jgi:hypothetical protein
MLARRGRVVGPTVGPLWCRNPSIYGSARHCAGRPGTGPGLDCVRRAARAERRRFVRESEVGTGRFRGASKRHRPHIGTHEACAGTSPKAAPGTSRWDSPTARVPCAAFTRNIHATCSTRHRSADVYPSRTGNQGRPASRDGRSGDMGVGTMPLPGASKRHRPHISYPRATRSGKNQRRTRG